MLHEAPSLSLSDHYDCLNSTHLLHLKISYRGQLTSQKSTLLISVEMVNSQCSVMGEYWPGC